VVTAFNIASIDELEKDNEKEPIIKTAFIQNFNKIFLYILTI